MYGSNYGSSYGTGYSSYGSYGGMSGYGNYAGINNYTTNNNTNNNPNQDPNRQEPPNARRQFMQQYFKMMGGLQSMTQMGFLLVAFTNTTSQVYKVVKKVVGFLMKTSVNLGHKFASLFTLDSKLGNILKKLIFIGSKTDKSVSTKSKLILGLRLAAIIFLGISYRLQRQIAEESKKNKQDLLQQLKQTQQAEELQQNWKKMHEDDTIYHNDGYI